PPFLACALIFGANYLRLLGATAFRNDDVAASHVPLFFLYAAVLYTAYGLFRSQGDRSGMSPALLYAGHLAFLASTIRVFDSGLALSIAWGAFALALLL